MDFLQNIDLNGNQLKDFVVDNVTSLSTVESAGRLVYNSNFLHYWDSDGNRLKLLTNKNGSIENANLAHSSVTIAGGSVSLGGTLAATAMVTSGSTTAKISLIGIVSGESQFKHNSDVFIQNGLLNAAGLHLKDMSQASSDIDLEVVKIGAQRYLHTSLPFYSDSSVSAGGIGTGGGGGGGDVSSIKIDGVTQQNVDGVVTLNLAAYVKTTALSSYRTASEQDTIDTAIQTSISTINGKIPSQASSSNQLADKSYVQTLVSTSTATFRGTSATGLTEAQFLAWANGLTHDNNDYVFWNTTDSAGNVLYKRYKYNGSSWVFEYALNNSSFDAGQMAAINSGITSAKVLAYDGYASRISSLEGGSATSVTTTGSGNVVTAISKSGTVITVTKGSTALLSGTTTTDIPEGTNKYYTDARVLAATNGVYEPLIAGDVDIKNSEFYFRPTADDVSVSDGTAKLQVVKGNAVAVNQQIYAGRLQTHYVSNGITWDVGNDGVIVANGTANARSQFNVYADSASAGFKGVVNHIYFYGFLCSAAMSNNTFYGSWIANGSGLGGIATGIISAYIGAAAGVLCRIEAGQSVSNLKFFPFAIDLTQMFGSGNEPSELTDPRIKWLQSLGYIPYNAGSLVPLKMTGIETTGVNQWDEETRMGYYGTSNGVFHSADNQLCTKNPIKVLPNTTYYTTVPSGTSRNIIFYDVAMNFIGSQTDAAQFTTPNNCAFIHIATFGTAYGTTYNHDIQVALYHSGGTIPTTYHPYEKHTLALDVTAITANGNRIFEDGMKAAGSVYDELTGVVNGAFTKAVKRVGKVNLGDLTWSFESGNAQFYSSVLNNSPSSWNYKVLCAKYTQDGATYTALQTPHIRGIYASRAYIVDTNYSTAAAFKTAMSGVYLYYELATPIEYDLDYPIPCEYYANDWGTEALIPQGLDAQGIPATAPLKAEIAYGINVKDTIRLLPVEYQRISGRVNSIGENSDDNHYPTARAVYRNLAVRTYDVTIATSEAFTPATYEFENDKLVASLYDANGNVVYADMQAVSNLDGKYTIRVEFASTSADTYKLVVIGKLA